MKAKGGAMRWSHVYKVDGGRRLNRAVYDPQPLDSVYHVYRLLEVYRLPPSTTVYLDGSLLCGPSYE